MLPEQINYLNDLPFAIGFSNVAHELPHYHEEMEVVLVLKGSTNYKVYQQTHHLNEGDILILDTEDLHYIYDSSSDILMLTMHLNLSFFDDIYPDIDYMIFACNAHGRESTAHLQQQNELDTIKTLLAELMMLSVEDIHNHDTIMDRLHKFIYVITTHFQSFFIDEHEFISSDNNTNKADLARLYRIIKYIYYNYDKKITLNDIAELEHLSPYYISHMIKSTSGLNFQSFLNYMRMEFAEKSLADKDMTLTQVSEACGFSSLAYMNKCFREWHGITASEYQKRLPSSRREDCGLIDTDIAFKSLKPYLSNINVQQNIRLRAAFPLKILLDTFEDIIFLYSNHEKVKVLSPVSIIISNKLAAELPDVHQMVNGLRNHGFNVEVYSDALSDNKTIRSWNSPLQKLIDNPQMPILLMNNSNGLFYENGLPTVFYGVYKLLSEINGEIVDSEENYISFKEKDSNSLLIFNDSKERIITSSIKHSGTSHSYIMIKTELPGSNNISAALKLIDNIDLSKNTIEQFYQYISGQTDFSMVSVSNKPDTQVKAQPDTILFVQLLPYRNL